MFKWLFGGKPTCPVEPQQRTWVDGRTRWLVGEFGHETARKAKAVLPTPEFFPDAYDGSPEAGRTLFDQVGRYMGLDTRGIEVLFWSERPPTAAEGWTSREGAAGLYEGAAWGTRIQIDASALEDPLMLVATSAHELAHVLLLGQGRLTGEEPDHEEITDLLTVYLGLGVFTANSRVRDRSTREGHFESWSIRKTGYLGQQQVGYALAVWARLRGEAQPAWAGHLCADVRAYFKQAARWLEENGLDVLDERSGSPCLLSDDELPRGFGKSR